MKYLVAYFSWSGNTRKIASQINRLVDGDIHEIRPANDYPVKYNDVLNRAKLEIRNGDKPELKEMLLNAESYDVLCIGYPNWWNTFPAPVFTFLSENDFTGKIIIPFCTHGGGGSGRSFSEIAKICPGAVVRDGFSINGYAVSDSNSELNEWINQLKLNRL